MAARPPAKSTDPSIIDLTASDDEDNRPARAPSTQYLSTYTNQLLQDLPPSDHGLIFPGTFDFSTRPQSMGNIPNCSNKTPLPTSKVQRDLKASQTMPRSQSAIRLRSNLTQANVNRRSTEQTFSRDITAERRISLEGNAAKRRKMDGGMASQSHILAPPVASAQNTGAAPPPRTSFPTPAVVLPPVKHRMPGLVGSQINEPRIASGSQIHTTVSTSILPARRQEGFASAQRASSSTQSVLANVSVPRRVVSLAARLEADRSRVSLDGRIQKPQNISSHSAKVEPSNQQMSHVLRHQVYTHIRPATGRYNLSLSIEERHAIGSKTARKLVAHGSFLENLRENDWKLSAEYERELSKKAQAYVDEYVSEILHRVSGSEESLKNGEDLISPDSTEGGDSPPPGVLADGTDMLMSSSSPSIVEEEVFESMPAKRSSRPPNRRTTRRYSSSPTTSFSVDNDEISAMDIDSHAESKARAVSLKQASRRRSLRRPRIEKIYTAQVRVDSPEQVSDQKRGTDSQKSLTSLDVTHVIQSLRLVGADKSTSRPYLTFKDREDIRHGFEISGRVLSKPDRDLLQDSVFHMDFCLDELQFLSKIIQAVTKEQLLLDLDSRCQVVQLMRDRAPIIPSIISVLERVLKKPGNEAGRVLLQRRGTAAIFGFLYDAVQDKIASVPQISRIMSAPRRKKTSARPLISSLLRQREIHGMAPVRVLRGHQPLNVESASHLEDSLIRKSEWTDCCGDISTVSWTGENTFICGATAHSDPHNMQYNKPGNLAIGSTSLDTLRAVSNHRIIRPLVGREENAENSLESMRQTQDPWLYTSVVSTSHSETSGFTFSASFDHTVKIWKAAPEGSIDLCGAWYHDGKVNFVVTSDHHERVATASDVYSNAIRVYNFDEQDIFNTPYDTYCGEKAREQALEIKRRDTWAYFPATIQWGKSPGVVHFLLVGYSPRSITAHEIDIPEDKKNSGELCLWNVELGTKIPISSARTQNVFEVMWHPTQPLFLAATSPCGTFEPETRTQIRLFAQNETGSFLHIKALDCPAFDINELTIMPNSSVQCYVTASCTDGNTYVWDTARGDYPIHTLGHGESLDNPIHDLPREIADTGVKFASWGKTVDRFYTGSSDGKVKAWDIRKPKGHAFVRTVVSVSGGISAGAFSKNYSKLLIGDATGKVHLFEVDDSDPNNDSENDSAPTKIALTSSGIPDKRPKVVIPHPEPTPPPGFERHDQELTAQIMAQEYLLEGHLTMHADRGIGVVQGPNYAETLLIRYEAHEEADGTLPLLPEWQAKQRFEIQSQGRELNLPRLPPVKSSNRPQHAQNVNLDFEFSRLSLATQQELTRDGVDLDFEPQRKFDLELLPRSIVFKEHKARQKRTHNI